MLIVAPVTGTTLPAVAAGEPLNGNPVGKEGHDFE